MKPDITNEQCWTNINGPPPVNGNETFDMTRAVYAGNGIWYAPDDTMGRYDLKIYKYDQNTGEFSNVYYSDLSSSDAYLNSNGFTHLAYDKASNQLAVIYTNDELYYAYNADSTNLVFYINIIDLDNGNTNYTGSLMMSDIANPVADYGIDLGGQYAVWCKNVRCISFYNGNMTFLVNFTVSEGYGDVSSGYSDYSEIDSYTVFHYITSANLMDRLPGTSVAIDQGNYSSEYINSLADYIEIGSSVYALVDVHCPEWNYYSLARFNMETGVYTNLSNALSIYGNDGSVEQICGARLTTNGTDLYMLANYDIVCIHEDDGSVSTYSGANVAGYSSTENGERAKVFFYYNGVFYIYCVDASTYNIESEEAALDQSAFYQYGSMYITSSNEIAKSNCVFTSFTNGTDNCYWFNGNDTVDRWPIITVDEEAYCFMKIKE